MEHRRFSGRQITVMVVAAMVAVVAAPVGALAATGSFVNITDPVNAAQKARVDATGHLEVGDGSGALTVDGAVRVQAPATPWWSSVDIGGTVYVVPLEGPTAYPIDITSLTISMESGSGAADFSLMARNVASTTTSCSYDMTDGTLWHVRALSASRPSYVTFPTPLQWRPPSGMKACLYVFGGSANQMSTVNASGFLG